jgi:hypothetical protein
MTGGLLKEFTVSRNVETAVNAGNGVPKSVKVSVIVDDPILPDAGFIVTVQLGAVPPMIILAFGIIAVSADIAIKFEQATAESISEMVKLIAGVEVFISVD